MFNILSVTVAGILVLGAVLAGLLMLSRAIRHRIAKDITDSIG